MSWFRIFIWVFIILFVIYLFQPAERKENIQNWFQGHSIINNDDSDATPPSDINPEDDTSVEDNIQIEWKGKPVKEVDCISNEDCIQFGEDAFCDLESGRCYVVS